MSIMMITTCGSKWHSTSSCPVSSGKAKAVTAAACLVASTLASPDLLARAKAMTTAIANSPGIPDVFLREKVIQGLWEDERETRMKVKGLC